MGKARWQRCAAGSLAVLLLLLLGPPPARGRPPGEGDPPQPGGAGRLQPTPAEPGLAVPGPASPSQPPSALLPPALPPLAGPGPVPDPLRLTLDETLARVRRDNPLLAVYRALAAQADARALAAWQAFLPRIEGDGVFVWTNQPAIAAIVGGQLTAPPAAAPGGAPAAAGAPGSEAAFLTVGVVQQPLINVDRYLSFRQAQSGARAAELQTRWAVALAEADALDAYLGLRVAAARRNALLSALQAAEGAAAQAEAFFSRGRVPQLDIHRARTRLAEVRAALTRAQAEEAAAQVRLRALLGLAEPVEVVAVDEITSLPDPAVPPLAESLAQAPGRRADVAAMQQAVDAASHAHQAARSAYLPRLNGLLAYLWQGDAPFSGQHGWFLGLALQWRPFAGLGQIGKLREETAALAEQQARLQGLLLQVEGEIRTAEVRLSSARQQRQHAEEGAAEARLAARQARALYAGGFASMIQVLEADAALLDAELRLVEAQRDVIAAAFSYRLVTGVW